MNSDDEQWLVQKAVFERDLPCENNVCLFTGCLFPRCLFTGCWFRSCLFTSCLFVEPVACSPVTSCTGCFFSSYLFISCLFRFLHQLPIQVFKRLVSVHRIVLPSLVKNLPRATRVLLSLFPETCSSLCVATRWHGGYRR